LFILPIPHPPTMTSNIPAGLRSLDIGRFEFGDMNLLRTHPSQFKKAKNCGKAEMIYYLLYALGVMLCLTRTACKVVDNTPHFQNSPFFSSLDCLWDLLPVGFCFSWTGAANRSKSNGHS
jgi:hypothetical protein